MQKIVWVSRLVAVLVAVVFVVVSIERLYEDAALGDRILNFMILMTPALMILFVMIFFRHFYKTSGLLFIGLGSIYFFFFRPYANLNEGWPVLVLVILPLIGIGFIHFYFGRDSKRIS